MDKQQMRGRICDALYSVAPDVEGEEIEDSESIQDQLMLDSVDYLNFVVKLEENFKISIPEKDYKKFVTIDSAVDYLKSTNPSS